MAAAHLPPRRLSTDSAEAHAVSWFVFTILVCVLLAFDVTCLQTPLSAGRMSFHTAVKLTVFWLTMGVLFDIFILGYLGWDASLGFLQGFFLEYILSVDNLFVFHLVFAYYCTPEALLYRALYFGIFGAIVLRVLFLFLGTTCVDSGLYIFKFAFGAILIWSGIRSASDLDDEDTADPTNNRCIAWVTKNLPVSDNYEPHGHFFITVAEVDSCRPPGRGVSGEWGDTEPALPEANMRQESTESNGTSMGGLPRLESFEGSSLLDPHRSGANSRLQGPGEGGMDWMRSASDSFEVMRKPARLRRKASLLLLVVIAVLVVDLVFAVDSVASKLASVNDVFLNCSSSAFAMLSLRSMYFVMDSLTRTFQTLKYGIAVILVLMGLKFVFAGFVVVSNVVCFVVIMGICVASIVSSYWWPALRENCQRIDLGAIAPITEGMEDEARDDEEDRRDEEAHVFFERRQHLQDAAMPSEGADDHSRVRGRPDPSGNERDLEIACAGASPVGAHLAAEGDSVPIAVPPDPVATLPPAPAPATPVVTPVQSPPSPGSPQVPNADADAFCTE